MKKKPLNIIKNLEHLDKMLIKLHYPVLDKILTFIEKKKKWIKNFSFFKKK